METTGKTQLPGYYTATEAAQALGYRDVSYLSRLCSEGRIQAYRVGKMWFIPELQVKELEKQADTGRVTRGKERK